MATQKEIKLCQKIMALAIKINAQAKYNVWCEFHGHVNSFEARVTGKYDKGKESIEGWGSGDRTVYLSTDRDLGWYMSEKEMVESVVKNLQHLKEDLSKFLVKINVKVKA